MLIFNECTKTENTVIQFKNNYTESGIQIKLYWWFVHIVLNKMIENHN